jgi:hypothetical protein
MSQERWSSYRLRIVAEADPGALARIIERFVNINVIPHKVVLESGISGVLYVEVDVAGLSEAMVNVIVGKIGQVPCIRNAYWHFV